MPNFAFSTITWPSHVVTTVDPGNGAVRKCPRVVASATHTQLHTAPYVTQH